MLYIYKANSALDAIALKNKKPETEAGFLYPPPLLLLALSPPVFSPPYLCTANFAIPHPAENHPFFPVCDVSKKLPHRASQPTSEIEEINALKLPAV